MDSRDFAVKQSVRPVEPAALYVRVANALLADSGQGAVGNPLDSLDLPLFRERYLLSEFLRKYPLNKGVDTRATAISSMRAQEQKNLETNIRILSRNFGDDPRVMRCYFIACRKAATALGRFSPLRFREGLRHGPGSTVRLGGLNTSLGDKLAGTPTVTAKARDLAYLVLTDAPMWAYNVSTSVSPDSVLRIEDNEKVTTVPKNAETDRIIAIQPDMNIYLQLGVGYAMRHALERVGINLNDQSINQRRALLASKTGHLATVDLSSASDSITTSLVWDFLGNWSDDDRQIDRRWYTLMETLKCDTGVVDGEILTWQRFSAMGNGFTFELESLIFWALTHAVCEVLGVPADVSVYGDDIICPIEVVPLLEKVFAFCGFCFNSKKTHISPPPLSFRESCGKHYLNGTDVTPFYVDKPLDSADEIMLLANNICRWACYPGGYGRDARLKPVWDWVVAHLPRKARESGIPFSEANDGLIKDFDEFQPSVCYVQGPLNFYAYSGPGIWVLDPDTQVNRYIQNKVVQKLRFPRMRIGYHCKTFSKVFGERAFSQEIAHLIWHYNRSFRKYKPPESESDAIPPIPLGDNVESHPYKCESKKYRWKAGRRQVPVWKDCGPWL